MTGRRGRGGRHGDGEWGDRGRGGERPPLLDDIGAGPLPSVVRGLRDANGVEFNGLDRSGGGGGGGGGGITLMRSPFVSIPSANLTMELVRLRCSTGGCALLLGSMDDCDKPLKWPESSPSEKFLPNDFLCDMYCRRILVLLALSLIHI